MTYRRRCHGDYELWVYDLDLGTCYYIVNVVKYRDALYHFVGNGPVDPKRIRVVR